MTNTQQQKPRAVLAGDENKTGGWWFECSECNNELYDTTGREENGLRQECGDCGHEWWEGEFIDPEISNHD